jgi:hypothetical protein
MDKIFLLLFIFFMPIKASAQEIKNIDTSQVYIFVDSLPMMPNGSNIYEGLRGFLQKMPFPDSLHCDNINRINFEFVVSYDGSIIDKKVWFSHNLDECKDDYEKIIKEGLKLLDSIPKCKPGMYAGKYVNVKVFSVMHIHLQ